MSDNLVKAEFNGNLKSSLDRFIEAEDLALMLRSLNLKSSLDRFIALMFKLSN